MRPFICWIHTLRICLPIIFLFLSCIIHAEDQCEQATDFSAEEFLPNSYQNDVYRIRSPIQTNGYLNTYVIESDFGDFEAKGQTLLNIRLKEIHALDQLRSVSKTQVFAEAVVEAGLSPVNTIIDFSKKPVATIQGIPQGIGNLFSRYLRKTSDGVRSVKKGISTTKDDLHGSSAEEADSEDETSDSESSTAKVKIEGVKFTERYFKVSRAERAWHAEFGTDPYTSNEILQNAIKKVAWADSLGRFGLRLTGGLSIAGTSIIGDTYDLVWSKDPYALKDHNRAVLKASGANDEVIDEFLEDSSLSPSLQTALIGALEELEGVKGREPILQQTLFIAEETDAHLFLESLLNLVWIHTNRVGLDTLIADSPLPAARDSAGNVYAPLPADYLYWTCDSAAVLAGYREIADSYADKTLFIAGDLSTLARQNLINQGWRIEINTRQTLNEDDKAS